MKEFFFNYLGVIGLCIDIIGALIMFLNTPKVRSRIYLYTRDEYIKFDKQDKRRNNNLRLGIILIIIGFILQLLQSVIKQ